MVDGDVLVNDFAFAAQDVAEITANARSAAAALARRASV
jgi:hypothetical protein